MSMAKIAQRLSQSKAQRLLEASLVCKNSQFNGEFVGDSKGGIKMRALKEYRRNIED